MREQKVGVPCAARARTSAVLAFLCAAAVARPATADEPGKEAARTGVIAGEVSTKPAKARVGVVVYLEKVPGAFKAPPKPAVIDQKGMQFVPHVLPVIRGTTVTFLNSDMVRHNVFSPDGEKYDLGTWPKGEAKSHVFATLGVYRQLCRVHPEMLAFVVVLENPFFSVTGADGRYRIEGVPAGKYTLHAWGDKLKDVTSPVTVTADGTVTVDLKMAR